VPVQEGVTTDDCIRGDRLGGGGVPWEMVMVGNKDKCIVYLSSVYINCVYFVDTIEFMTYAVEEYL
jgi:hypothetical protein